MRLLTEHQASILRYIRRFIRVYQCAPTIRDIAEQFGLRSPGTVTAYLNALQRKGCIRWTPGLAHSIKLPSDDSGPQRLASILGLTAGPQPQPSWARESSVALAAAD